MGLPGLGMARCFSYLQNIVVHQAIMASVKTMPLTDISLRRIMTTRTMLSDSTLVVPQIQRLDLERYIQNKTCIIDVREHKELQETGVIPNSVNIPLGEIEQAFQLPKDVFQKKYKCVKPDINDILVFTCRSGKRSYIACEKLHSLGFKGVINYSGGWLDWEEKLKQQQSQ